MGFKPSDLNPLAAWRHFTSSTSLEDDCIATSEYCPARAFTSLTLPFPPPSDPAGTLYVVRRIGFTTTSHDQGFSGEGSTQGTYVDSQTFFDAYIVQPNGQERVRRRVVQFNVHAKADYTTHHRIWDYQNRSLSEDFGRPADQGYNLSWEEWLSGIRSGDEIRLVPRANFVNWTNYVQTASIEVWVEVIPPQPQTNHSSPPTDFSRWNDYLMYRPLDAVNREIRLVELEPSDDDDDVISFVLRYTPLADTNGRLNFSALSYCWGSADEAHPVMVRDEKDRKNILASINMSVNRNLYSALRKLRRRHEPQTLWIDLLCIKQSDLKERAQQVELMGEIYSSAHTVYVWLGVGDQWSYESCKMIQSVEESYERLLSRSCPYDQSSTDVANEERKPDEGPTNEEQDGDTEDTKLDLLYPDKTHSQLRVRGEVGMCFDQIFELPWFSRVWVLQEVWNRMVSTTSGLASVDATGGGVAVLCGSYELTWGSVIHANLCLESHRQWLQNKIMPRIWSSLFHVERHHLSCDEIDDPELEDMGNITPQLSIKTADRLPILEALLGGLDMEATDPRDKIFAILSFGKETHEIAELPPSARPSYEKSTIQVFSDFTKWWISYHGTLNILSAVHAQPWRTWMELSPLGAAPREFDYSQRPSWSIWYEGRSEWSLGTLGLFNNRGLGFCASGETRVDKDLLLGSGMDALALKGFRIDIIKSKEAYPYSKLEPYGDSARMLAAYEAIFDPTSVLDMWDMTKLNWQRALAAKLKKEHIDKYSKLAKKTMWEEVDKLTAHFRSHGFEYYEMPDLSSDEEYDDEYDENPEDSDDAEEREESEVEEEEDEDDDEEEEGWDGDRALPAAESQAANCDVPGGESVAVDEDTFNLNQQATGLSDLGVDQVHISNAVDDLDDLVPDMDRLRVNTPSDEAELREEQGGEDYVDSEDYEGEDMNDNSEPEWEWEEPPVNYFPCHGQTMFTTEGDKFGLCPAVAKEGDIIAVLYGGNVPYLLRPANSNTDVGRFYLVGECYLDGYMHGEAMELLQDDASGVKEEIFLLV